jgi:hypothetical protein
LYEDVLAKSFDELLECIHLYVAGSPCPSFSRRLTIMQQDTRTSADSFSTQPANLWSRANRRLPSWSKSRPCGLDARMCAIAL